ncbi:MULTISPECIES: MerR family transcriptional regulator [unclassified Pseudonocardia]|uniref:MerR family transcriptional regulator n=1 Tax=unclassified Pseudonocardia TaxID=2619320 RepID=UPI0001FFEFC0|nr:MULTISPECIES: MerR family transcriptional regulator [unclassified Pseudonocardia]OLM17044.1 putative MerR-family transcriptional regulator [Pseudonocardia sp. Ae707_Ps1]
MSGSPPAGDEYPIDQLAARAGMTVRNVRAHLSRGLLQAGEMRGRTAWYGPEHLARLDLIAGLQRRGFSLAAIGVLINQTPSGSAEEALRLYRGMLAPWQPEEPVEIDESEFVEWAGAELPAESLALLAGSGLLEWPSEGRLRILNPSMVRAGVHAIALGLSPESVVEVGVALRGRTREIADMFVALFRDQVWQAHVDAGLPRDGVADLRTAVEALQPVATQSLLGAFRQTMQEAMDDFIRQLSGDLAPDTPATGDRD